jgi:acyl carrier protein
MSNTQLHDELKTLISEIIEVDDFGDEANFVEELGVDSMLALEIVARIEKRYRIRIPEENFSEIQTLNAVVQMVAGIMQPVNR